MQKKIDFFIIGAQKAATTALFDYLGQHPEIYMPRLKENQFFSKEEFYAQGERYLEPLYREASPEQLWGGADVNVMYFPVAAERLAAYNPKIKVIAVLRNPVDRAYSAYWYARRNSTEPCETFEEALEREEARAEGSFREQVQLTYLAHGHYFEQLVGLIDRLGRDQLHVVLTQDLRTDPARTLESALVWLGVAPGTDSIDFSRKANRAGLPRLPLLHRLIHYDDWWIKRMFRRLTPPGLRYSLRRRVLKPVLESNIRPFRYPEMKDETRERLVEYFKPHNRKLEELIDRDLGDWD